ncbi:glycosyl hydrolase [Microbacterium sp. zg.Y909]|uniref:glycosyl hydrolase n=1 Tax=Microbacterium sp. zg.Y909 TaxID=2969413 RepID=UPI00214AC053|nr:glycosyl hydrolase [Microbacterium sp. zg.Y909]MCR2825535.1 glycosyl hydrolase [Microbacterium sp. zg.Y909]
MTGRRLLTALLAGAALVATGCTADPADDSAPGPWAPEAVSAATVSGLPVERIAEAGASRLAEGVIPPTNRWYSGLVFGAEPQPVYPFPVAFAAASDAFTLDLPAVSATEQTIAASFAGGLHVGLPADRFEAVRADAVSVTLRWWDAGSAVGDVTIAEGSPVVGFTAARETDLSPAVALEPAGDGVWTATADDTPFGVVAPGARWSDGTLTVPADGHAQWFALPDGADIADWAAALDAPITGVRVASHADAGTSSTRLTYTGTAGTVLVPFPGHEAEAACELGTFRTAYGDAVACAGNELEWSVPLQPATASFDLDGIDDPTRGAIAAQIAADLDATPPLPTDTYYGGKALARLGALLTLAGEVGDTELAARVGERLWTELSPWAEPSGCAQRDTRCFVYDDALRLVVGKAPSFGSEEGNDHHFHYGYFLSAAAALVAAQPQRAEPLREVMDALAADIAGGAAADALPQLRVFDPYRGHSWASGMSPFADGNNQESSSEAVAAWNGLALWAEARGDDPLTATATWLLSAEVAAARALWLEPDPQTLADGFAHPIVSLTWGGKRDYATWFSPEPSAILGIQLLPLTPVALEYLGADPARVAANVADAGPTAFTGPLGEYVRMYSALAGDAERAAAATALATLTAVDDGNSKAVMLAWLAAAASSSAAQSVKDP